MEVTKPALVHHVARANWYEEGLMLTHMSQPKKAFTKVTGINIF